MSEEVCWRCHKPGGHGHPLKQFERATPDKQVVWLCTNPFGGCLAKMKQTHPDYIEKALNARYRHYPTEGRKLPLPASGGPRKDI